MSGVGDSFFGELAENVALLFKCRYVRVKGVSVWHTAKLDLKF